MDPPWLSPHLWKENAWYWQWHINFGNCSRSCPWSIQGRQELSLCSWKQKGKHTKPVKPRQPSCKDAVHRISLGGTATDMLGLSQLCLQWEINLDFCIVPTIQGWEQVTSYLFLQKFPSAVSVAWRSLYHLQWTIIKHSKTQKTVCCYWSAGAQQQTVLFIVNASTAHLRKQCLFSVQWFWRRITVKLWDHSHRDLWWY